MERDLHGADVEGGIGATLQAVIEDEAYRQWLLENASSSSKDLITLTKDQEFKISLFERYLGAFHRSLESEQAKIEDPVEEIKVTGKQSDNLGASYWFEQSGSNACIDHIWLKTPGDPVFESVHLWFSSDVNENSHELTHLEITAFRSDGEEEAVLKGDRASITRSSGELITDILSETGAKLFPR